MDLLLVLLTIICALQAIRAGSLLAAAIWLASVSVLVSILLYGLGAPEVAVIELSVGAGLVTVLFVFAITVAGEEAITAPSLIPKPAAGALCLIALLLLAWMIWSGLAAPIGDVAELQPALPTVFWELRGIDALVQLVLIFTAVLSVLALLAREKEQREI